MTPIQQALYKYWDALRLQVFILFHLRDVRERLQTMEPMEPDTKDTSTTRHFRFPVEYEISTLLTTPVGTKAYTSALTHALTSYGHPRFDLKLGKAKALFGEEPADEKASWWIELTIGQPTSTRL